MKRTSLTTAVIAGIAGVAGISNMANAVFLNPDGLGSVLIYPYYTVNGGNNTAISVVNTTALGKAVKVRFLEAWDSREVLDFNLYMSPFDVWTAVVLPTDGDASGKSGGSIFTPDNSCTVPTVSNSGASPTPFLTLGFSPDGTQGTDGGPTTVDRTSEGYVELIEMGTVIAGGSGTDASGTNTLGAIKHGSNGVPPGCAQVLGAWAGYGNDDSNTYWSNNPLTNIGVPSGGLFGSGTIFNSDVGTVQAYNADAIDQFYSNVTTAGQHSQPGDILPNLSTGTSLTSYVFVNGALATSTYSVGEDAVSSLFMADALYNEFQVDAAVGGSTEWVVTFPTKRFYVDPATVNGTIAIPPFDQVFGPTNPKDPYTAVSCSPISLQFWDREEKSVTPKGGFSPPGKIPGNSICYESQVITFNQAPTDPNPGDNVAGSTILGSKLTRNITLTNNIQDGWALINFASANHRLTASTEGNVFVGLPVTGFATSLYVNTNFTSTANSAAKAGTQYSANFTTLNRHRSHRTCTGAACS